MTLKPLLRRCAVFSILNRKPVGLAIAISLVWIIIGGSVASGETFLRTWGSFGSGDGQFNSPFGLAVQGDKVFVVDFNHRVQVFNRDGTFLRTWGSFGSGNGQFMFPVGVAVQANEVFVTDAGTPPIGHRVQVFDRSGKFLRTWGSFGSADGQFSNPVGVAVQGNEVYVVDYNDQNYPPSLGDRVQVFDRNGMFVRKFGSFGSGDGQFNGPFGVAVVGSKVFVVDRFNNRVQVFVRD